MSTDPMAGADGRAIIVFDGVCVLCSGWVRFLLRHDPGQRFHFAAMQSVAGRELLTAHGIEPDDPGSFLLVEDGRAWTDTDAVRRVVASLGGHWRAVHGLALLPRFARDRLYRLVARNRYRWFGRHDACFLPSADQRARFLD